MTPEEFRSAGHKLVDWIADYRSGVSDGPVLAVTKPGEVAAAFSTAPPSGTSSIETLLNELEQSVVPGVTQVQHPMHYGWFPSNASLASVLGDFASSGLGGLGISWESCPALTEVEEVVCDWMRQLTGLSDSWSGTIQDTASTACLVALLTARERATEHSQAAGGMSSVDSPPVVYTTGQAHSSVRKAALLAGCGADHLRTVDVDPTTYAMDPAHLVELIRQDAAAGLTPAAIVASVGTTGVTAFDPLPEIIAAAQEHNVWVHVDAAMAGSAMLLPEYRFLWDGVEGADSLCWNPHKWMGTILDTSLYFVRDVEHLVRVMSTNPSYLRSNSDGSVTQFRDWGLPLGRRFRALKLWFHLELDGVEAIQNRLRRDLENARWLADQIEQAPDWELVSPVPLQTVCVRHRPDPTMDAEALDRHTLAWVEAINQSGQAYLTPSILDGLWMVRISIGVEGTERSHVEQLWSIMKETAASL
ncbi:MAG: pyridoxal phosphate-dependent decarboxylase family protein [Acidimicrobiales bacterium]